nr:hypothetical protein Q903MT_gene3135 [Picea sitchensis]
MAPRPSWVGRARFTLLTHAKVWVFSITLPRQVKMTLNFSTCYTCFTLAAGSSFLIYVILRI